MHDFTNEELEITELPEREEMLTITLGAPDLSGILALLGIGIS